MPNQVARPLWVLHSGAGLTMAASFTIAALMPLGVLDRAALSAAIGLPVGHVLVAIIFVCWLAMGLTLRAILRRDRAESRAAAIEEANAYGLSAEDAAHYEFLRRSGDTRRVAVAERFLDLARRAAATRV